MALIRDGCTLHDYPSRVPPAVAPGGGSGARPSSTVPVDSGVLPFARLTQMTMRARPCPRVPFSSCPSHIWKPGVDPDFVSGCRNAACAAAPGARVVHRPAHSGHL